MIPNLFILSGSGEVLIEKQWQSKHKRAVCDLFWEESAQPSHAPAVINPNTDKSSQSPSSPTNAGSAAAGSDTGLASSAAPAPRPALSRSELPPVIATPRYTFVSIYRSHLTFLTVCSHDTSPLFVLEWLQLVAATLIEYITELTETSLRDHFALIYQLLDEMNDGGFPSVTELNVLQELIAPPSLANKLLSTMGSVTGDNNSNVSDRLPLSSQSKIPWRKSGVRYVNNEIYFDCVESLDAILNQQGQIIHSNVYGEIQCNCKLSGMPDLTLSFTRPQLLDDVSFHRCVRINRYQRERVLSFVPPDGQFTLCHYRVPGSMIGSMPFYIKPLIQYRGTSGRVQIMCGSKLHGDKPVTNVSLSFAFPSAIKSHTLKANVGTLHIDERHSLIKWDIGRLPKEFSPMLEGALTLASDVGVGELTVINGEFIIKLYAVSGLKVEGLAIRNVNYKPFKGVRMVTQAGKFQVRCCD